MDIVFWNVTPCSLIEIMEDLGKELPCSSGFLGSLAKSRLHTPPRQLQVWQEYKCLLWMRLYWTITDCA